MHASSTSPMMAEPTAVAVLRVPGEALGRTNGGEEGDAREGAGDGTAAEDGEEEMDLKRLRAEVDRLRAENEELRGDGRKGPEKRGSPPLTTPTRARITRGNPTGGSDSDLDSDSLSMKSDDLEAAILNSISIISSGRSLSGIQRNVAPEGRERVNGTATAIRSSIAPTRKLQRPIIRKSTVEALAATPLGGGDKKDGEVGSGWGVRRNVLGKKKRSSVKFALNSESFAPMPRGGGRGAGRERFPPRQTAPLPDEVAWNNVPLAKGGGPTFKAHPRRASPVATATMIESVPIDEGDQRMSIALIRSSLSRKSFQHSSEDNGDVKEGGDTAGGTGSSSNLIEGLRAMERAKMTSLPGLSGLTRSLTIHDRTPFMGGQGNVGVFVHPDHHAESDPSQYSARVPHSVGRRSSIRSEITLDPNLNGGDLNYFDDLDDEINRMEELEQQIQKNWFTSVPQGREGRGGLLAATAVAAGKEEEEESGEKGMIVAWEKDNAAPLNPEEPRDGGSSDGEEHGEDYGETDPRGAGGSESWAENRAHQPPARHELALIDGEVTEVTRAGNTPPSAAAAAAAADPASSLFLDRGMGRGSSQHRRLRRGSSQPALGREGSMRSLVSKYTAKSMHQSLLRSQVDDVELREGSRVADSVGQRCRPKFARDRSKAFVQFVLLSAMTETLSTMSTEGEGKDQFLDEGHRYLDSLFLDTAELLDEFPQVEPGGKRPSEALDPVVLSRFCFPNGLRIRVVPRVAMEGAKQMGWTGINADSCHMLMVSMAQWCCRLSRQYNAILFWSHRGAGTVLSFQYSLR